MTAFRFGAMTAAAALFYLVTRPVPGACVLLERVTFRNVWVRTPKVHRMSVTMVDCLIINWSGPALDVQLGGSVNMIRTRWEAGPDSLRTYYTPTGGTVTEFGTVWIPFRRQQRIGEL